MRGRGFGWGCEPTPRPDAGLTEQALCNLAVQTRQALAERVAEVDALRGDLRAAHAAAAAAHEGLAQREAAWADEREATARLQAERVSAWAGGVSLAGGMGREALGRPVEPRCGACVSGEVAR